MKRAERQYALVDVLRAARYPMSAARLSREFEVSARTIERDIQSLQLAGVPIYADYGVTGGYSILREYSMPPLNLSGAESLAVLAGLALLDPSPFASAARRARAKILGIVDEERADGLQDALSRIRVVTPPPATVKVPIELIPEAIAASRVVRITYSPADGSSPTVRDVEPMELLRGGDSWLLVGWCRLRDGIRGFPLEQITSLEITTETAPRRDPALLEADLARWPHRRLDQ
jgi:predicted DNA-binding transcriptional regulator YafY